MEVTWLLPLCGQPTLLLPSNRSTYSAGFPKRLVNVSEHVCVRGAHDGYKYVGEVWWGRHPLRVTCSTFSSSLFLGVRRLFFQPCPWIVASTHERSRWGWVDHHRDFELFYVNRGEYLSNVF